MRLSNWDQRQLDIESGKQLDKAALSEDRVVAEPVAWNCVFPTYGHFTLRRDEAEQAQKDGATVIALYAAPPDSAPSGEAVREALDTTFDALVALQEAVKQSGKMNGREYIDLGIQVNKALDKAKAALTAPGASVGEDDFQSRVQPWMTACFGPEISRDKIERNHRFIEEALELVQANGCTAGEAHQLVDYVYGRPVGEIKQEVGGVMVTLAALCLACDLDMHACGETELARVWTKVEQIRAKQAAKPKHSPLPGPSDPTPQDAKAEACDSIEGYFTDQYAAGAQPPVGGTLPPSASKPVTVDEIAREIDPDAFSLMDLRGPNGWSTRTERYAERVDKATSLATAILALINAQMDWQPIDSAPKDGREIEVKYLTDDPRRVRWSTSSHGTTWHLTGAFAAEVLRFDPTDWRPFNARTSGVE